MPDIREFAKCVSLPADSFPRIAAGVALGKATGVKATPTVWVNGDVAVNPHPKRIRALTELILRAPDKSGS